MCIDYRDLNRKTMNPDSYIHAAENQQHAGRTKESKILYFCTLDIQQGYHNVELAEDAKLKTAFHAHAPLGVRRIEHLARTFQRRLVETG